MTPKTKAQPQTLLTLHAVTTGASSAQMAVTWCAHDGLAERIQEAGFKEPRLLIITRYAQEEQFDKYRSVEWYDSQYQLVKLQRGMAYVTFRRPGRNQVAAIVVDVDNEESRSNLKSLVRRYSGSSAYGSIWNQDTRTVRDTYRSNEIHWAKNTGDTVNIDVDPELFAKPLSPWRAWVLKRVFGGTKLRDECQARKRSLIFGPILLPPLILFTWLTWLLSLVALPPLGFYKFPWSLLKRPFTSTTVDWVERSNLLDRNFIYQRADGEPRNIFVFILSPHLLAVIAGITFGIMNIPVHYTGSKTKTHPLLDWGWWHTVFVADGLYVSFVATVAFGGFGLPFLWDLVQGRQRPAKPKTQPAHDWDAIRRQLEFVACGDRPTESLSDLSIRQLTPRLVFNAAKAKVCKPFAS